MENLKYRMVVTTQTLLQLHQMGLTDLSSFVQITRYMLIMHVTLRTIHVSKKMRDRMATCINEWREEYHAHDFDKGQIVLSEHRLKEFNFIIDSFYGKQHEFSVDTLKKVINEVDGMLDKHTVDKEDSLAMSAKAA